MPDTLPRLNLDEARAVLASCDGAPHASGAACQRERAALVEEVAQLRETIATIGAQAEAALDIGSPDDTPSRIESILAEARTALSPASIAQQSPTAEGQAACVHGYCDCSAEKD